ncbi:MAG: thiamine pyrophosphate-binding protein [Methanomicrobiaceae archaeon]|nr:thiamine pyrophosphate-binding protein [Methanomicrobiaceae archaeon]
MEKKGIDSAPSIGEYLIQKIQDYGAGHVFGVPGDYVLNFYAMLSRSPLAVINTCDEQGAGFAADAYARMRGLGVVCVTYNVGGLKVVNTTAEAFAEKSPVLVIAGAPGWGERKAGALLHHLVRDFDDQYRIFERITVASTELRDPAGAYGEIDRVISEVLRRKGPGYIELPRDMVNVVPGAEKAPRPAPTIEKKEGVPSGVLDQVASLLNAAARPVIMAGVEVARHGLGQEVASLAEKARIPMVSTMLGKSAIAETHPLYLGIYAGVIEDPRVREYVEGSDCLLLVGVSLNDVNLGGNTATLDPNRMITLSGEGITLGGRSFSGDGLGVVRLLAGMPLAVHDNRYLPPSQEERFPSFSPAQATLTPARIALALNAFMDESMVLIADIGDAVMSCIGITTRGPSRFLSPIYYSSLGFSVPAAIGVQAACPDLRPVVVVGDGAFQMTGMEISTAARYGQNPIVVVLNNSGFGTERPMIDGPFNDVAPWQYHRIPEITGRGKGCLAKTEKEFFDALAGARASGETAIIEAILDPLEISPQLQRMCERLAKGVKH